MIMLSVSCDALRYYRQKCTVDGTWTVRQKCTAMVLGPSGRNALRWYLGRAEESTHGAAHIAIAAARADRNG